MGLHAETSLLELQTPVLVRNVCSDTSAPIPGSMCAKVLLMALTQAGSTGQLAGLPSWALRSGAPAAYLPFPGELHPLLLPDHPKAAPPATCGASLCSRGGILQLSTLGLKRHRCTEQTFGLCGRRRDWDDLREQHQKMYIIKCETDHQSRLDA